MSISINIPGDEVQLTGNRITVECSGGAAPAGSTGYMILLKITSTDGKLKNLQPLAMAPDENGEAKFNLKGSVDQHLFPVFQFPATGTLTTRASQIFNIQVQAGERYIDSDGELVDSSVSDSWDDSATMKLLKGGLSQRQVNWMNSNGYSFYSQYLADGKFLTARPWGNYVHPNQPVKLWFMPVVNATKTRYIKAYYDDGTDDTEAVIMSLNTDNLYEINCNPQNYGMDMQVGDAKMTHFDVWIDGFDSNMQRFHIDWRPCERPVFIMFANTFGGVDDVYFSGYIKDKFVPEPGETSYREPQDDDTVFTPTLQQLDKAGQNRWTINTGPKALTEIQYLRDLLVSKQAWYLYTNLMQTTTNIIPIMDITAGDEVLVDRKKDLYALDISFSEAHISKHSFDNRSF